MLVAGSVLTNCGEASKKDARSAKENLKDAGKDLKQAGKNAKEEMRITVKAKWERFRSDSETLIYNTEGHIKELRKKIANSSQKERERLTKELDSLEQKNRELKEKLAEREREFREDLIEFNEMAKEKQNRFEKEFKHDMQLLKEALLKIVTPPGNAEIND